jgi:predicted transcriptional regulator
MMEDRQIEEIQAAITEFDEGPFVSHEEVSVWLKSWGTPEEIRPPTASGR